MDVEAKYSAYDESQISRVIMFGVVSNDWVMI